jgi:hypothetical protein
MQQGLTDQQPRRPRLSFGVDVHATKAEYIQALWRLPALATGRSAETEPPTAPPPVLPDQAPRASA